MIDVTQIRRHTLQQEPYAWAEVGNLFSPRDAEALAASFLSDHYKALASYGGEKDWEYEARALIPMGEPTISFADMWSAGDMTPLRQYQAIERELKAGRSNLWTQATAIVA